MTNIADPGTQGIPVNWQSLAYHGRHRAEPHPDWVSSHPDRLGSHAAVPPPFRDQEDAS
jgi:hypothetical protein